MSLKQTNKNVKPNKNKKSSTGCNCSAQNKSTKKASKPKGKQPKGKGRKKVKSTNVKALNARKEANSLKNSSLSGYNGVFYSEVHTTETFEQFYKPTSTEFNARNGFISVVNRFTNLDIVRALEGCKFKNDDTIKKVIKGLSCCSSLTLVEVNDSEARLKRTSKRCRRKICPICNRMKAAKYVSRFVSAFNSPTGWELFKNKYFSFLTLSLKHNRINVRNNVYLKEFKKNLKQLQRSKLWKKHFPYSKLDPESGWANCFELTITKNGFNIHVHILVCAPRYKGKIVSIEEDFRQKWEDITGDTRSFRIDLIKMDKASLRAMKEGRTEGKFLERVIETFKYAVKVGNSKELAANIDDLAEFLIETKGQNMVVAGGFFRGLQLFGLKSIWDEGNEGNEDEIAIESGSDSRFFTGRTVDLVYSKRTNRRNLSPLKGTDLDNVYLKGIDVDTPENVREKIFSWMRENTRQRLINKEHQDDYSTFPKVFMEVTTCIQLFSKYLSMSVFEADFKTLPEWIIYCKERSFVAAKAVSDEVESTSENEQLKLFIPNEEKHVKRCI
jgi:hypothetical protein